MGKLADIDAPHVSYQVAPLFGEVHLKRQQRDRTDNHYCWEQRKRGLTGNSLLTINIDGQMLVIRVTKDQIAATLFNGLDLVHSTPTSSISVNRNREEPHVS